MPPRLPFLCLQQRMAKVIDLPFPVTSCTLPQCGLVPCNVIFSVTVPYYTVMYLEHVHISHAPDTIMQQLVFTADRVLRHLHFECSNQVMHSALPAANARCGVVIEVGCYKLYKLYKWPTLELFPSCYAFSAAHSIFSRLLHVQ